MNMLFVHPPEGNALELFKAFELLDNTTIEFLSNKKGKIFTFIDKVKFKLKLPSDKYNYNKLLLTKNLSQIDVIFIVKGVMIYPKVLKKIKTSYPNLKLVSFSLDDMFAWHNRSIYYTLGLKYYDLVCTNKSYNMTELKTLGAKKMYFSNNAYSKNIHYPIYKENSKYAHDVLFIGTLEKQRFESMNFLAKNGIQVHVYTDSFDNVEFANHDSNLIIHKGGLYYDNHCEAITNSKITLCFLRKINRDLQTTRSVEIPACGGCMLAERTEEHLRLFEEGTEAVYFNTDLDLLKKTQYLLSNDLDRVQISKKGIQRCEISGYSYQHLASNLINQINQL
ncbi:CgeB family protein [Lacinutrix sp. MEBiC02595]